MTTTTAKLAAAKLNDGKGIPDELVDHIFHTRDAHYVAIVDLAYLDRTEGRGDTPKHVVRLEVDSMEILTGDIADHARELMRAAHREHADRNQLALDVDGTEPGADEIIRRGRNLLLLCQTCLHKAADERINHAPDVDADGAECTWKDTGNVVTITDEQEAALDAEAQAAAEEADEQTEDGPWPGDPDYVAPDGDLAPTSGIASPFAKAAK